MASLILCRFILGVWQCAPQNGPVVMDYAHHVAHTAAGLNLGFIIAVERFSTHVGVPDSLSLNDPLDPQNRISASGFE